MKTLLVIVLVLGYVVFVQRGRLQQRIPCERCGAPGTTAPFRGTEEIPNFYRRPLDLCLVCRRAQESFLTRLFMLRTETRLGFGMASIVQDAERHWGDRATEILALLLVARDSIDLARRILDEDSFARVQPWLEQHLQADHRDQSAAR